MLIIPATLSIQAVEQLFESISLPNSSKLQIPVKLLNGGSPGLQAAVIQLLATWSREHSDATLCLTENQFRNGALNDEVFRTAYGLNALLLATKVISNRNQIISRQIIQNYIELAIDPMDRQQYSNTLRGPGALLECLTDGPNEFISPFYQLNQVGELRAKSEFHQIAQDLLASCNQTLSRRISKPDIENIGNVLYELMKNTDEHARENLAGEEIFPGIRGVLIRLTDLGKLKGDEKATFGDSSLATYFSLAMLKQGPLRREAKSTADKSPFIELSVFDAGPGLAMRWASAKTGAISLSGVSVDDELSWVAECFELHKTTKASRESGRGLAEAASTFFKLGAFVRLRTGRLSLVQNFLKSGTSSTSTFNPDHWDPRRKLLSPAAGTCFTIIFPVLPGSI